MTPPRARAKATASWNSVELASIVLVQGAEGLLVDRSLTRLRGQALERDPETEFVTVDATTYASGDLQNAASPSLFGEARLVIIDNVNTTTDALVDDVIAYLPQPEPDVHLILAHRGGQRGKKILDTVRKAGAVEVACEVIKKDSDKATFVTAEFRAAGRRIESGGVQALVEALGSDLRELAAACAQLVTDTTGTITAQTVARYYGGRVEVTGFKVADAAVSGDVPGAVVALRHALATGTDPVPLVAALAAKLRTLAKVGAMRSDSSLTPSALSLAPWQVDRARRELSRWTPQGLAEAIEAVAQADAEVKGASRDPVFAVERAVITVAMAATNG